MAFLAEIEAYVWAWHGVAAPNGAARVLAAELEGVIRAFEGQRGRLGFEEEPSGFEAALQATKEVG